MPPTHTTVRDGKRLLWYTERLWELAEGLEPFEIDIEDIPELDQNCWFTSREATLREVAKHYERIRDADLSKPVILNADGSLMDGGHRICKALIDGRRGVAAVRFEVMPEPDQVGEAFVQTDHYLDPSEANAVALLARNIEGRVTMLNLLRFREVADYSDYPDLAPAGPISGSEAYQRYIQHTLPFLHAAGGELAYIGTGGDYLIGPAGEGWDLAMLVKQDSVESFMNFASDPAYLAGIGHRAAAVSDSRILPLVEQ